MKLRRNVRARRRSAIGLPGISERLQAYLLRFPCAVRRDIRNDARKRRLSFLASLITDGGDLAVSLGRHRAKLVVRFDDGTPDMPWLLPGMKWRMWE